MLNAIKIVHVEFCILYDKYIAEQQFIIHMQMGEA